MITELSGESVQPRSRASWRQWLARHHTRTRGIWLILFKKATGRQTFDFNEAIEEAICFGWIDSKPAKVDDERSALWFAPRKPGTGWSRPNQLRVAKMTAEGKMAPAGIQKVLQAQSDGSWSRLDSVENLEIPDDLAVALNNRPPALAHFQSFPRSVRRGILEWILQAKRPDTRARRIDETARLAARNERANQWRR